MPLIISKVLLDILKGSRLFRQFSNKELEQLISFSAVRSFKQGATIIEEGVYNEKVYVLIEGTVKVVAEDEFILKLDRKGDLVGEMSVITKKKQLPLL